MNLVVQADAARAKGNFGRALAAYAEARSLDRTLAPARQGLVAVLQMAQTAEPHAGIATLLADCLADPAIHHQSLARCASQQIRLKYQIDRSHDLDGAYGAALVSALESDRLVLEFLIRTVVADPALERALSKIRRRLLRDSSIGGIELRAALALQCFHNEYVWWAEADEIERVEKLAAAAGQGTEASLATVAMYRPVYEPPVADAIVDRPRSSWSAGFEPIVQTLYDRLREQSILEEVESFSELTDPTSRAVALQYEMNPYPRWIGPPPEAQRVDLAAGLRRRFPHLQPLPTGRPMQLLCAGCGTGRHALSLSRTYEQTEITGIDLSRRSLAYAIRRANELGIGSVRFLQGDILAIDRLEQRFDIIEAVGVIHHMAEPVRGLKRMVSILNSGGAIRLGLYSEHQRYEVVAARRQIESLGLDATADGVRRFRQLVLDDPSHRGLSALTKHLDFFTVSGVRDLLFHVQECRFTIRGIRDLLDECGLEFVGFENIGGAAEAAGAECSAAVRYRQAFPGDREMRNLDNWVALERGEPGLALDDGFTGYIFWAQKRPSA